MLLIYQEIAQLHYSTLCEIMNKTQAEVTQTNYLRSLILVVARVYNNRRGEECLTAIGTPNTLR